jgi:hypothetical protein
VIILGGDGLASTDAFSGSLGRAPTDEDPGYKDIIHEGYLDIIRVASSSSTKSNYIIDDNGLGYLYINPFGEGARKIRIFTNCVEELPPDANGDVFYRAFFGYINENEQSVFVPFGGEYNNLSGPGARSVQGELISWFETGENQVPPIIFDGKKLTWSVWNIDSYHNTSASSAANAGVGGCNQFLGAEARIADSTIETSDALLEEDQFSFDGRSAILYPNPAKDKLNITFSGNQEAISEIELIDSQGKMLRLDGSWNTYSNSLEVDISKLNHGLYLIKLSIDSEARIIRFVKE